MRALEFNTTIKNNQILIPPKFQPELKAKNNKNVRVIVLVDDSDIYDDLVFNQVSESQFLKGYAETDSIYDNY